MHARQLPQPSTETARRRLTALLDETPDDAWDDVDAEDGDQAEPLTAPERLRQLPGPPGWRRETAAVVGAIVLVGVVLSGLVLFRSAPVEIPPTARESATIGTATPEVVPAAPAAATPAIGPGPATSTPTSLAVHVIGEVQRPGLVLLEPGARVDDAITAAQGLTSAADPGDLNLAQPLQDGQQVRVGSTSEPGGDVRGPGVPAGPAAAAATGPPAGSPSHGAEGVVNLNTATVQQLEELPGVGPVTAQKIVAWREQNGGFSSVEQLMDVPGIGPKTYAEISPRAGV